MFLAFVCFNLSCNDGLVHVVDKYYTSVSDGATSLAVKVGEG